MWSGNVIRTALVFSDYHHNPNEKSPAGLRGFWVNMPIFKNYFSTEIFFTALNASDLTVIK